jgi:hypothetical protein
LLDETGMKTIDQTASTLRDKAGALKSRIEDSHLRELAIEKADQARRYVSSRGAAGIGRDLVTVAKEHPVATAATVAGLAFLASRLFRRE